MTQRPYATRLDPTDERGPFFETISPLDVGALFKVLWHGKWLILCMFLVTVAAAGYFAFRMAVPQFTATATLHWGGAGAGGTPPSITDGAALNTAAALVLTDPVLAEVIDALDLRHDPEFNRYLVPPRRFGLNTLRTQVRHWLAGTTAMPPDDADIRDKTIQNLRRNLTVTRQRDSYILDITAQSSEPDKAVRIANATTDLFIAHIDRAAATQRLETEIWLESQITTLQAELDAYRQEAATVIAAAQVRGDVALDDLTTQVLAVDQDLREARNALALLVESADGDSTRNTAIAAQLRAKIADLAALKDRRSTQLSVQSSGLAALDQIELRIAATQLTYQGFVSQLQENRLQQGLAKPAAQRIAPATEGTYAGPRKILMLEIAGVLGLALGVLAVAMRHINRKGFVDARALRKTTGLPVIAQFSQRILKDITKNTADTDRPATRRLSQAGRSLQSALALIVQGGTAKVILSTASMTNEGSTQHAVLLASTLGLSGKRVLLIYADAINTPMRRTISAETARAAKDAWRDSETGVYAPRTGFDVLMIDDLSDHETPLLSEALADRLKRLRHTYEHIIIDGPPVLLAPEARLLAQHSDAILYAVRWSATPRDIVQQGLQALDDIGHPATGVILSWINPRKMRQLSNDPYIAAMQAGRTLYGAS